MLRRHHVFRIARVAESYTINFVDNLHLVTQPPMRNRLTSQLLKALLNHKLKEYGKMTTLHIDTQAKHISLTANLLGETEPIDASMKYVLEESDGRTFFVPQELDCSRQWLSLLAQQMLKDNVIRFEIPNGIATTVLKMLKI
jgi:hypothetical protein